MGIRPEEGILTEVENLGGSIAGGTSERSEAGSAASRVSTKGELGDELVHNDGTIDSELVDTFEVGRSLGGWLMELGTGVKCAFHDEPGIDAANAGIDVEVAIDEDDGLRKVIDTA